MKPKIVNARIPPGLAEEFQKACIDQQKKVSEVLRQLIMAYVLLIKRANGTPIHTLEFKGFEEKGDCIRTIAPSLLQVAERKAGYGLGTSRTKELAKR